MVISSINHSSTVGAGTHFTTPKQQTMTIPFWSWPRISSGATTSGLPVCLRTRPLTTQGKQVRQNQINSLYSKQFTFRFAAIVSGWGKLTSIGAQPAKLYHVQEHRLWSLRFIQDHRFDDLRRGQGQG
jgi:hypothetical protein